ncbi:MAG: hypothetical protein ACYCOR_09895 [Acidobacteriaceae bacterium]
MLLDARNICIFHIFFRVLILNFIEMVDFRGAGRAGFYVEDSLPRLILNIDSSISRTVCHTDGELIAATHGQHRKEIMKTLRKRETEKSNQENAGTKDKILPSEPEARRGRWSTAFLMAGSALLGATAVAFWNRRTIANMRIQILSESAKPQLQGNTDEEIF